MRVAGGILPLVSLLRAGESSLSSQKAAGALRNLAANNTANQDLIREAGGITQLVQLLHAGPNSIAAQESAAALANLAAGNTTNKNAIREAGAIAPLVQLLQPGGTDVAQHAFAAIANVLSPVMALFPGGLLNEPATQHALAVFASLVPRNGSLEELIAGSNAIEGSSPVLHRMQESSARRLQLLLEGPSDAIELQRAVDRGRTLHLPEELLEPAEQRLHALEEESAMAQSRRREAVEADARRSADARVRLRRLGASEELLHTPPEFLCPITQEKMADPVVASDGHSYEREAIVHVLFRSNGLSPLTREKLRHEVFPNIALRKRIAEYNSEVVGVLERFISDGGGREAEGSSTIIPDDERANGKRALSALEGGVDSVPAVPGASAATPVLRSAARKQARR